MIKDISIGKVDVSLRKRGHWNGKKPTKENVSTRTSNTRNQTLVLTKCKADSAAFEGFIETSWQNVKGFKDLFHSVDEEKARWAEVETRLKHGKALYEAAE
jgi:hypothetical protein